MPFRIDETTRLNQNFIKLSSEETGDYVEIAPFFGGTVTQIGMAHLGNMVKILRADSDRELAYNPLFRGRILFPFNDRIQDAQYEFEGKTYHLMANSSDGSAIHGYLYNRKMNIEAKELENNSAKLILSKTFEKNELPGYPFSMEIKICYTLFNCRFRMEFEVKNLGDRNAPYGLGWHPYFKLNTPLSECRLTIPSQKYVEINEFLIPTGEFKDTKDSFYDYSSGETIAHQDIDLAYKVPKSGESILENDEIILTLLQDPKWFPYLQVFIPEDRDSIAIEPVTGPANVFNCPELGLSIISPEQTIKSWTEVKFQSKGE